MPTIPNKATWTVFLFNTGPFQVAILVVFILILVFMIIQLLFKRYKVYYLSPWSIILVICIIFGCILSLGDLDPGAVYLPYDTIGYVMLPIFLLSQGLSVRWKFSDVVKEIILYGIPVTISTCFILSVILYNAQEFFSFTVSYPQAIVISAVICVNDIATALTLIRDQICPSEKIFLFAFAETAVSTAVLQFIQTVFVRYSSGSLTVTEFILIWVKMLIGFALGILIGLAIGFFISWISLFTYGFHLLEPFIIVGGSYIAFIASMIFGFPSGVAFLTSLSIIKNYGFKNISDGYKDYTNFMLSGLVNMASSFIFIVIGVQFGVFFFSSAAKSIDWGFVFFIGTTFYIVRFGVIFIFGRARFDGNYAFSELFLLGFCGIKGGVTFALSLNIYEQFRSTAYFQMISATIIIVMFHQIVIGNILPVLSKVSSVPHPKKTCDTLLPQLVVQNVTHLSSNCVREIHRGNSQYSTLKTMIVAYLRTHLQHYTETRGLEYMWAQSQDLINYYQHCDDLMVDVPVLLGDNIGTIMSFASTVAGERPRSRKLLDVLTMGQ